jgi:hypothetical protein
MRLIYRSSDNVDFDSKRECELHEAKFAHRGTIINYLRKDTELASPYILADVVDSLLKRYTIRLTAPHTIPVINDGMVSFDEVRIYHEPGTDNYYVTYYFKSLPCNTKIPADASITLFVRPLKLVCVQEIEGRIKL